jgi:hypothetical protein
LSFLLASIFGIGQIRVNAKGTLFTDSLETSSATSWPDNPITRYAISFLTLTTQSTATLQGRIVDPNGAIVPGAKITLRRNESGFERIGESDKEGNYQVAALVGSATQGGVAES